MDTPSDSPVFTTLGLAPDLVDYRQALERQQQLHSEVLAGTAPPTVLLLEHADVYTAGKRTEPEDLPRDNTPVIDVDRGGKLTWHGEGQLVVYPIIRLADRSAVKHYVCALERTVIDVLRRDYGIESARVGGRSGVWITGDGPDRKIAAVGLRVHHSVTTHGLALNCSNDLAPFDNIIACGISDAGTTSISAELGRTVSPADILPALREQLAEELRPFLPGATGPTTACDATFQTSPDTPTIGAAR